MNLSVESQRRLNRAVEQRHLYYPASKCELSKRTATVLLGPPAVGRSVIVKNVVELAKSRGISATEAVPRYTTDSENIQPNTQYVDPDFMIDQIRHRQLASWSQNHRTGELSGVPIDAFSAKHNFFIGDIHDENILRRAGFKMPFTALTIVTDPKLWEERMQRISKDVSDRHYTNLIDQTLDTLHHGNNTHPLQKIVIQPDPEHQIKVADTILGLVTQKPSPHYQEIAIRNSYYPYNNQMYRTALQLDMLRESN